MRQGEDHPGWSGEGLGSLRSRYHSFVVILGGISVKLYYKASRRVGLLIGGCRTRHQNVFPIGLKSGGSFRGIALAAEIAASLAAAAQEQGVRGMGINGEIEPGRGCSCTPGCEIADKTRAKGDGSVWRRVEQLGEGKEGAGREEREHKDGGNDSGEPARAKQREE